MQYMPTTPKAKCKGANDSLPITKQALGKGGNRPVATMINATDQCNYDPYLGLLE